MSPVSSELLADLRCPTCGARFLLDGESLVCEEQHVFPVRRGIARLAPREELDAERSRTADAFGYSWGHYPRKNPYTESQWRDWVVPLTPADFEHKVVLDAGCGLGGFSEYARAWGARRVVGVDLSSAIDAALDRLGDEVELVQGDILSLPFAAGTFDVAYSIGVLHHLPDPERGFRALAETVKPGGLVFAWVYGRENNGLIVNVIDPLRRHVLSRLPRAALKWGVSLPLAALLWPLVRLAGSGASFPYSAYFRFLSERDFSFVHGVVFDHLVAPTSHYIRRQEFEAWFRQAGLVDVQVTWRNRNSWRGLGRVPVAAAADDRAAG